MHYTTLNRTLWKDEVFTYFNLEFQNFLVSGRGFRQEFSQDVIRTSIAVWLPQCCRYCT